MVQPEKALKPQYLLTPQAPQLPETGFCLLYTSDAADE